MGVYYSNCAQQLDCSNGQSSLIAWAVSVSVSASLSLCVCVRRTKMAKKANKQGECVQGE